MYTLLTLFEEFDIYTTKGSGVNLESNAILRVVLPQNIESFSKLQYQQEKRYVSSEQFRESLNVDLNTWKDNSGENSYIIQGGGVSAFGGGN